MTTVHTHMMKTATIVTIATMVINRDDCDVIRLIMPMNYLINNDDTNADDDEGWATGRLRITQLP